MTPRSLREFAIQWMADDPEAQHAAEVQERLDDEPWLSEHFATPLDFGTAGIRGKLGAGPAFMNRALVRRVTAAVGATLSERSASALVVIGFDARDGSRLFASDAARVLGGLGHRVRLFEQVVPTPRLAHAVTWHRADAGLMITASHNPPKDNGIKVYDALGAQIVAPVDADIRRRINWIAPLTSIATPSREDLSKAQLIEAPDATAHDAWLSAALNQRVAPHVERTPLRIGYSAMHGVAGEDVVAVLQRAGHHDVRVVSAQQSPDGAFPTLPNPNPQDPSALSKLVALGIEADCRLLLANDPDGDRLAVVTRDAQGRQRVFSGDEIGLLLAADLLAHGDRSTPRCVVASLVSSGLLSDVAKTYGARSIETLTGFKWISRAALAAEENGERFVFGFEEAIGYCAGLHVRDKDGVTAAVLVADLAARLATTGRTLEDALYELFEAHQLVVNVQQAIRFEGPHAADEMADAMTALRNSPPRLFGAHPVQQVRDLLSGQVIHYPANDVHQTTLPSADVLEWRLENGDRVLFRPSGTEPKLKIYAERRRDWQTDKPGVTQHQAAKQEAHRLLEQAANCLRQRK